MMELVWKRGSGSVGRIQRPEAGRSALEKAFLSLLHAQGMPQPR